MIEKCFKANAYVYVVHVVTLHKHKHKLKRKKNENARLPLLMLTFMSALFSLNREVFVIVLMFVFMPLEN